MPTPTISSALSSGLSNLGAVLDELTAASGTLGGGNPSTLIDGNSFGRYSQVPLAGYDPLTLGGVFSTAHTLCALYLGRDPAIQVHPGEYGEIFMPHTGRDAYQMIFKLKHYPLISANATDPGKPNPVFSALQLLFPAPFPTTDLFVNAAALAAVVVRPTTGRVYVPFLGLGGLAALTYQYGAGSIPTIGPTGYLATYTAGYAITAADRTAYPTAQIVPAPLQQACAWIVELLLAQGARVGDDLSAALSGTLAGFKNMDYEERYHVPAGDVSSVIASNLFGGSSQGRLAQSFLDRYRRSSAQKALLL